MKNKKGFVMTETLVVTVFLVTIFTFIYVSIVPLIGKYEDVVIREKDIDIVYKLYHLRKMVFSDSNRSSIISNSYKKIECTDISNPDYCSKMLEYLELNNYLLVYVNDIYDNLMAIKTESVEMYNYAYKHQDDQGQYLILLDMDRHTICHLLFDDGSSGSSAYYAFGEPTTSSTQNYTTLNKNVFIRLQDSQLSVCILRNGLQCFNNNNWNEEKNHIQEVFSDASCDATSSRVYCIASDFYCGVFWNGYADCGDNSTGDICNLYDQVYCGP